MAADALEAAYKQLQRQLHPDKFSTGSKVRVSSSDLWPDVQSVALLLSNPANPINVLAQPKLFAFPSLVHRCRPLSSKAWYWPPLFSQLQESGR